MPFRKTTLLTILLASPLLGLAQNTLSLEDVAKVRMVHKKYEETWLRGDAEGVRALFTDDSVLLPPHAGKPCLGHKGLNDFWFPPNAPPTKITKLVVTLEGIGGDGQLAYTWGTDEVAWNTMQDGKVTSAAHTGRFLNVLRKQPNGDWKISHHMWDDAIPKP
jgi:ketosteroid isomerase-like protein